MLIAGRSFLHIQHIAIDAAYRGRGLGRELIGEVEKRARKCKNCRGLELMATTGNKSVIRFYETMGFHEERKLMVKTEKALREPLEEKQGNYFAR